MSTFIGQLIGFAVIVFILMEVGRAAGQGHDAQAAGGRPRRSSPRVPRRRRSSPMPTRCTPRRWRRPRPRRQGHRGGRHDSERIAAQLQRAGRRRAERIKAQGAQQVQLMRQQLIRELRSGLGDESVQRPANWCVLTSPIRPRRRRRSTASSTSSTRWRRRAAVIEDRCTARLRAASRAVARQRGRTSSTTWPADSGRRRTDHAGRRTGLGGEAAAPGAGAGQAPGRAVRAIPPQGRTGRATAVRQGVDPALDISATAVSQRWSSESDLVRRHRTHRAAGAAEAGRGRRPGRRRRGSAVPVRPHPRLPSRG